MFSIMKINTIGCILIALSCLALTGCPPIQFSRNVDYDTDFQYGVGNYSTGNGQYDSRPLYMDRLEPNDVSGPNRPCVLLVHGGGFDGGSRADEDLLKYADGLTTMGYVCFTMDYRLLDDPPPAPDGFSLIKIEERKGELDVPGLYAAIHAAFVDTKVALRHLRANAPGYGIDPDRIVVMGESAGAFAAIAAAVTDEDDFASDDGFIVPAINNPGVVAKPQGIIDFWGNGDFVLEEFDGDDPPFMVAHGLLDDQFLTFYPSALAIVGRCIDVGIPYNFYTFLDKGHGAWDGESSGKDLTELSLDFLADVIP